MKYETMFKELTPEQELEFRQYAMNDRCPDLDKWEIYHPVCRDQWRKNANVEESDEQVCLEAAILLDRLYRLIDGMQVEVEGFRSVEELIRELRQVGRLKDE